MKQKRFISATPLSELQKLKIENTFLKKQLKVLKEQLMLGGVVGRSEQLICHHCGKYKRLQGNGIMHQLCECGE